MSDVTTDERARALDAAGRIGKQEMVAALQAELPDDIVLHDEESLRPFECDGLSAYRMLPMIAVLPSTIEQVQTVMRICYEYDTPVVARGAGTGLSGGALPLERGVLLSLAKFNQILDVDTDNMRATVQPGVRNLAISQAVDHLGLYYAPDPSSQIACSIGGNVAENSGGVHCLKYGLTTHNIVKLEIVTIEGERLTIGSDALDTPGYDLLALMTGSEGLLGVIVEVTVKLLAKPELARVALVAFDDVRKYAEADRVAAGEWPSDDNPLVNAPHPAEDLLTDDWGHPYPRELAAYPSAGARRRKYWPPVSRVDNAHGDRNLVCACPPMEDYA